MNGKPEIPVAALASAAFTTVRREIPLQSLIAFSSIWLLWSGVTVGHATRNVKGAPGRGESMDLGLRGLRAMVSAGAGGIGLEIARAFVAEGARVHVCDVDAVAIARLSGNDEAISGTECDVSDRAQVARFFDEGIERL